MNRDEILSLPPHIGLPTAGRALGMSRSHAYEMARRGEFPATVLKLGGRYRVVTAHVWALLGLVDDGPELGKIVGDGSAPLAVSRAQRDRIVMHLRAVLSELEELR